MSASARSPPAPYVGLRPFEEREALLFFGRTAHIRDLLKKFARQRFTAVVGVSGSGKSSLVRAGLIPALYSGDLSQAGHRWNVFPFKPGNAPLANLAKALVQDERWAGAMDDTAEHYLAHALAASPLALCEMYRNAKDRFAGEAQLLVVDQFEEIFRYRRGDEKEPRYPGDQKNLDQAEAFVKLLLRSAAEPELPIYALITLRTDFLGQCSVFYGLPEAINSGIYLTPRLDRSELTSVIASPLALAGGSIDGALVARLINTLADEDELPVLEHALLRMWQHARENSRTRLDEGDFEAVCPPPADPGLGEAGSDQTAVAEVTKSPRLNYALDSHASEIYDRLTPAQQRIGRRAFLALSERREGQDVRRPQRLCDLLEQIGPEARDDVLAVIEAFRAEGVGFLMPPAREALEDNNIIDISHESLIRQWRYFERWLREEEADVAELREWQHRAAQNRDAGGGWLDEHDAARAGRWRARIEERGRPEYWLKRYFPSNPADIEAVFGYIDESARRLEEEKRLEKKERDAKANAERERERAEASALASRRLTRLAVFGAVWTLGVAALIAWLWLGGLTLEHGLGTVLSWLRLYRREPEMVELPKPEMFATGKNCFQMGTKDGAPDEAPQREVCFAQPFRIGKYEVSFDEYDRFLYATGVREKDFPSDQRWGRDRRPVINVSWEEAAAYATWLSAQTGKHYRLPTEAEWEYAARAGTDTAYWWDNEMEPGKANCIGCGGEWDGKLQTAPVDSFEPNPFGLKNTAGNVWEWVEDCWHETYGADPPKDGKAWKSEGGGDCGLRVVRGGSWNYLPRGLRASRRDRYWPGARGFDLGFRLAQDL